MLDPPRTPGRGDRAGEKDGKYTGRPKALSDEKVAEAWRRVATGEKKTTSSKISGLVDRRYIATCNLPSSDTATSKALSKSANAPRFRISARPRI